MLKISGHDIFRNGEKVGFIETANKRILSHDGHHLGYFDSKFVYSSADGRKLGYIDGNYLFATGSGTTKVSLDTVNENVIGGILPEIGKCAVYILIGV